MSTRKELVRDKIKAVARLWYASEPDKGLRERLTEGLIDKMTAAVLPALAEASQRSETAAALAALAEYDRTGIPQPSVAAQARSESGTRERQEQELAEVIASHVAYFNGWWVDAARMRGSCLDAAKQWLTRGQAGSETPAPAKKGA